MKPNQVPTWRLIEIIQLQHAKSELLTQISLLQLKAPEGIVLVKGFKAGAEGQKN